MKKLLFFAAFFCCTTLNLKADPACLEFVVEIFDKGGACNPLPKSPVRPPQVTLDDNVLTFEAFHPDYTLILLDQNGEVVFEAFVMAATYEVVLPNDGGTYELLLHTDSWYYFVSTITI